MSSKAAFHPIPIAAVRFQTHLGVGIVQGPLSPNVLAPFWGRDPLLIRSGFDADNLLETDTWPSWDTITQISFEEDADSRIIKHVPGDFTSFTLDVGPFVPEEFDALHDICWTLVVNDVDRFHPPLAEWMDQTFSFIPRWRRDDGQVSLATKTGGIGPHCDNYDVFLIQASGEREWIIGKDKITVEEEMESLIEGIDVRILKDWNDRESTRLILKPGDVLYLPPRVAHCGIALADGSMTLSVGCRTPSASDIISRLAERLTGSVSPTVVRRYEDVDLLLQSGRQTGEITPDIKNQMKKLVSDALHTFMEDENQWGSLVGEILTESTRLRYAYPLPLADADPDWIAELGVWGDPKQAVAMVLGGKGAFFRAEGVSFAYSKNESAMRLFANGESFEILSNNPLTEAAVMAIINESELTANTLGDDEVTVGLLEQLVAKGLLYGSA